MKRIEITEMEGTLSPTPGKIYFFISVQTKRGDLFGDPSSMDRSYEFISSTGFILSSLSHPQIFGTREGLFVRGDRTRDDEAILIAPSRKWLNTLQLAIKEYNERYISAVEEADDILND